VLLLFFKEKWLEELKIAVAAAAVVVVSAAAVVAAANVFTDNTQSKAKIKLFIVILTKGFYFNITFTYAVFLKLCSAASLYLTLESCCCCCCKGAERRGRNRTFLKKKKRDSPRERHFRLQFHTFFIFC